MKKLYAYSEEMEKQVEDYNKRLDNANRVEELPENLRDFISVDMTVAELVGAVALDAFGIPKEYWAAKFEDIDVDNFDVDSIMKPLIDGMIVFEQK